MLTSDVINFEQLAPGLFYFCTVCQKTKDYWSSMGIISCHDFGNVFVFLNTSLTILRTMCVCIAIISQYFKFLSDIYVM